MTKLADGLLTDQAKLLTTRTLSITVDKIGRFVVKDRHRPPRQGTGRSARLAIEDWARKASA